MGDEFGAGSDLPKDPSRNERVVEGRNSRTAAAAAGDVLGEGSLEPVALSNRVAVSTWPGPVVELHE